jgi:MFS family permease
VLIAAKLGWMLDAMDFLLYVMVIGRLKEYFHFDDATAGLLGTITLLISSVGGLFFGAIADRFGRARALIFTVLVFSLGSLGAATSQTLTQLLLWRALLGLGMGGEWASGAALVCESWPAEHRVKAIGIMQSGWALGYILAAIAAAVVLDVLPLGEEAWRWLFVVGALPAFFTLWVRRSVPESPMWLKHRSGNTPRANPFPVLFGARLWRRTVLATLLTGSVMFANWGLFFWLPTFLATPIEQGGAGMTILRSMSWIIPMQIGAYIGYLSFGFIADRIGRRPAFILYLVVAAVVVPIYGQLARSPGVLMALGPLVGFVGYGFFSLFGAFLAELFPTAVRATGQGLAYNVGRGLGALAPFTIGAIATIPGYGIGTALGLTSGFFIAGALLILTLPDTSGRPLPD